MGDVRPLSCLEREFVLFRGEDGEPVSRHTFPTWEPTWVSGVVSAGTASPVGSTDGGSRAAVGSLRCRGSIGRLGPRRRRGPSASGTAHFGGITLWRAAGLRVERLPAGRSELDTWRSHSYRVRVHVQDLTENIIDRSHFLAVHDMARPERDHFEVRFDGVSMVVEQSLKVTAVDAGGYEISTTSTTSGPGIVAVEVSQDPIEMLTYITQTPVDEELTEVTLSFSMRRLPDDRATEAISELNDRITNEQFTQDVAIWENKIYREHPMVTKVDGPVAQYRRWFRQFYPDQG